MRLKTILKEPLLHFLVIGIVLFVASASRSGTDRGVVLVTYAEIELLAANYAKAWGRAPTQEELRGVIDDRVQEEATDRDVQRRQAAEYFDRIRIDADLFGRLSKRGDLERCLIVAPGSLVEQWQEQCDQCKSYQHTGHTDDH